MSGSDTEPPLSLLFYVYGDPVYVVDRVSISQNATIPELIKLLESVYLRGPRRKLILIERIFKIDILIDNLDGIQLPENSSSMSRGAYVSTYWPGYRPPDTHRIDILVKCKPSPLRVHPVHQPSSTQSPNEPSEDIFDRRFAELSLNQIRLKDAINKGRPFATAKHSNFMDEQLQGDAPIYNGRPRARQGLPLEIYHPAFYVFTQHTRSDAIPDPNSLRVMEHLISKSQAIYSVEAERTLVIKNDLECLLGVEAVTVELANGCVADGVIMTKSRATMDDLSGYLLVMEVENEVGTGQLDPSIQGAKSYARYWSDNNLDYIREASCCPSFILAIAGPWVCILGAVWAENIVVHPFTDYIWMGRQVHDEDRLCQLTRMFIALRHGIYSLRQYYGVLPKQRQEIPGRFFPYIKEFSLDGENVQFDYLETLALSPARPVFRAVVRSNSDRLIVVKFVRNYNSDAHKILAEHGLAPRLIYDSVETLDCGFRMIVMEHIDAPDLFAYLKSHPTEDCISQIFADVRSALTLLHQNDLVFGDLRQPNVLVVQKQQGLGAMLIDFDWCSIHKEGRYPLSLNDAAGMWTQGIARGGLMDKKHDNDMFGILFNPEGPF